MAHIEAAANTFGVYLLRTRKTKNDKNNVRVSYFFARLRLRNSTPKTCPAMNLIRRTGAGSHSKIASYSRQQRTTLHTYSMPTAVVGLALLR